MPEDEKKAEKQEPEDTSRPPRHKRDRKEVSDVVDRLVSRYGNERAALAVLADENLDYRESLKELKARVPADGSRVLSADEVKQWDAFVGIGKPAKDIVSALSERDTFATENATLKAEQVAGEVGELNGYKPAVLSRVLRAEGYRLELADEKDDKGESARVAYGVKGEGDKSVRTQLTELIDGPLSDYKPALLTEQTGTGKSTALPTSPPRGTAPASKNRTHEQIKEEKRATGAYFA